MAYHQQKRRLRRSRPTGIARRRPQVETLETRSLLASFTTLEDTPLTIDVPTGQLPTVVVAPRNGTVDRTNAGDLVYRPAANYNGGDSFVYRVGDGDAARETVSITITAVNDPPRIQYANLTYEVQQGIAYNSPPSGVLTSVSSVDGEPLRASLVSGPEHGTLTLNADGSFVYQSHANFYGVDYFIYRASEGSAATDSATGRATLAVRPRNDLPQAYHDQYSTPQDTVLRVEAPGVLANDGHTLPVSLVRGPARGTVTLAANGGFVYTPPAGFNGIDTFVYRINDPAASSYPFNQGNPTADDAAALNIIRPRTEATVTIRVGTIVERPQAVNDSYAVRQGAELSVPAPGVLGNDRPAASNTSRLSASLLRGPEHGTLTLNVDGSFVYKPNADFIGIDVFRYLADDAAANVLPLNNLDFSISAGTVSIYVTADSPPLAQADNFSVQQNTPFTVAAPGVLGNDIGSGRPLRAELLTRPEHGTLVFSADGSFTYTPATDFYGVDTFNYRAGDAAVAAAGSTGANGSSLGSIATVFLYVRPAKLPLIVQDDHYVAMQNTVLEVAAPGVLGNDYIFDVQPPRPPRLLVTDLYIMPPTLSATLLTGPVHGTVTLNTDGSFRYTPIANYVGPDTFTYRARWENGLDDPAYTGVGTVTISVNPADRTFVARDDSYVGLAGTPLEVAAPGVLGNDSRPDGTAVLPVVAIPPSHGTLTLNANGSFRYVPNDGFSGYDEFTYRLQQAATTASGALSSNTANVSLYIRPNNPVVRAEDDHYATPAGTELKIEAPGVLKNDVAIPILSPELGGVIGYFEPRPVGPLPTRLTAALVRGPSYGTLTLNPDGSFVYTPRADFAGVDTFTYRASAAAFGGPGLFIIDDGTVRPESGQPPAILPHDIATVTINVHPTDRPPVARDDSYVGLAGTPLEVAAPGVLGNDERPAGTTFLPVVVTPPLHGTLTLNPNGSLRYVPSDGYSGNDYFSYRLRQTTTTAASGVVESNTATVWLYIRPNNPVARAEDDHYTTPVGTELKVEAPGVLKNDSAIPILPAYPDNIDVGAPIIGPLPIRLTASLVRGPSYGTLSLNADGGFVYTPQGDFAGVDTFTYRASAAPLMGSGVILIDDGTVRPDNGQPPEILPHDIATVTINVIPRDQGPVVARDNEYRLRQDSTLTVAPPGVLGNDFSLTLDPTTPGNVVSPLPLTAELVRGPEHGTLTLRPDGGFTYTPVAGFTGLDHFRYRAVSGPHSDEATVYLRVVPPRPAPRFVIGPHQQVTDDAGARAIVGWTRPEAGDPATGTQPTFAFDVSSDNASLFAAPPAIDPSGRLTYAPRPNASGTATVTVVLRENGNTATEGEGESAPQTFTITITKPNPRYNTELPLDVSRDAAISPIDAVLIINYLNATAARADSQTVATAVTSADFLDTNKDNAISAIDAVLVINYLNSRVAAEGGVSTILARDHEAPVALTGEGESAQDELASILSLIADETAEEAARKRRML